MVAALLFGILRYVVLGSDHRELVSQTRNLFVNRQTDGYQCIVCLSIH